MLKIRSFSIEESGATAIEYALIAALVAIVGIAAYTALGSSVSENFANVSKDFCEGTGGEFELTETGDGSCSH
ncbi:MAG: Flp family type IVb pilin [Sneathiellales bacterium]|nr:Flp family type IVb pilin [Sneathiellales bacterium]